MIQYGKVVTFVVLTRFLSWYPVIINLDKTVTVHLSLFRQERDNLCPVGPRTPLVKVIGVGFLDRCLTSAVYHITISSKE